MIEIIIIIIAVIVGWIGGQKHANNQWIHCSHNNYAMRLNKKYCYEVKYIGIDNSR